MSGALQTRLALLALPGCGIEHVEDERLRRWLALGNVDAAVVPSDLPARVAAFLGLPAPGPGLAALRYRGQTGERPAGWLAAADAVYFEPRLDHLGLYALPPDELAGGDLAELFDELEQALGGDGGPSFRTLGGRGYLFAAEPLAGTAGLSPAALHGREPSPFLPEGPAAGPCQRLQSEIQMVLHASPVQQRRQLAGLRPVNALWLWGGGPLPETLPRPLPPLFADDPLLRGYWLGSGATVEDWPGSLEACADRGGPGFVAVPPLAAPADPGDAVTQIGALRRLLEQGHTSAVAVLFADGTNVLRRRAHRLRFWRKATGLPRNPGFAA